MFTKLSSLKEILSELLIVWGILNSKHVVVYTARLYRDQMNLSLYISAQMDAPTHAIPYIFSRSEKDNKI